MLRHPDNDHWHEWREAFKRTGYTKQLSCAARMLEQLEAMNPYEFERACTEIIEGRIPCLCSATTNIADEIEYGTGGLSFNGFWEFPCAHRNIV